MNVLEHFIQTERCPNLHDKYVQKGWGEYRHSINCYCDCSYCIEAKLRNTVIGQ